MLVKFEQNRMVQTTQNLSFLTLKWSRGVPMDPKISFRALARKRKVIGQSPSLTLSNFTLRFFWWQKNLHRPCASSAN